jgi:translation initiation factor 2 beta subunit (eIF-2beta)/eIF-5
MLNTSNNTSNKIKKMNMNGSNDNSYRYKMPCFVVTQGGGGNGRYTTLNNIEQISNTINHPSQIICKLIANITGSNYIEARNQLTGTHTSEDLNKHILQYIKYMVLCPKCNIPETIPTVYGTKKNAGIQLNCSACKSETKIIASNKYTEKGVDIIVKYLNSGNMWTITKGMITKEQTNDNIFDQSSEDDIVAFDDI